MRFTRYVALAGLVALAACNDAPAGEPAATVSAATPDAVAVSPSGSASAEETAAPPAAATPSQAAATPSASPSPAASAAPTAAPSPRASATAARAAPSPAATVAAAAVPAGNTARGKALFNDWSCGSCHTLADAGASGSIGPSLDRNSKLTRDYVVNIVTNGQGAMPSFAGQMTDAEIAAVAAYIVEAKK